MPKSDRIAGLRPAYADAVCKAANVGHEPVRRAFAAVPREAFLGPGPWTMFGPDLKNFQTPDADPAHIYRDKVVSLVPEKLLNNGQPSYWAMVFDRLKPRAGERVIYVGAGTGYYTALLAEMVGAGGAVTGIEYEADLAAKARANLKPWPNVEILAGDSMTLAKGAADIVVASCGVDQVPVGWVRLLNDSGRLLVPLTCTMAEWSGGGWGANLLATRDGARFSAALVGRVGIYHCMSARSEAAGARLKMAFASIHGAASGERTSVQIALLRLGGEPNETCWLAGDGWWLSTAAA